MEHRKRDPVDLMLDGNMNAATETYLAFYIDALESGDRFIGADLLSQLHFSMAGEDLGSEPEAASDAVQELVMSALRQRELHKYEQIVADDIAIAKRGLVTGRKRSEKSVESVDRE